MAGVWDRRSRHGRRLIVECHPETDPRGREGLSPIARAIGFVLFAGPGLAVLAAVILLPEYTALTRQRTRRDALAHVIDCEKRLPDYYERKADAFRTDPDLTVNVLIRHANWRPAAAREANVPLAGSLSVPEKLAALARTPPPPRDDGFIRAGKWLDEPLTQIALIVLSLGMVAGSMAMFGPRPSASAGPTAASEVQPPIAQMPVRSCRVVRRTRVRLF